MNRTLLPLAALALAAPAPALAAEPVLAPSEIVADAPKADWVAIAPSDLLVMDLTPDAKAKPRRVVIQLMPPPFSQGWIGNIRQLAAAHWWDGLSVNRVQDNYVVQWGDADGEDKGKAKALPADLATVPEGEYMGHSFAPRGWALKTERDPGRRDPELAKLQPPHIYSPDAYADAAGFTGGFPIAMSRVQTKFEGADIEVSDPIWPVHCYGMVGVGRDMPPNTGSGAELYVVIGHAPRHLDRNIALVGRMIEGIEHLSSLPRGTGALGFYETPEERTGIASVRLGSEVAGLPTYEYLSTESSTFARYADARANRRDAFFVRPAGGADVCNIPVPVRRVK